MYGPFIFQCVVRPQYALLQRAYEAYRINSRPCGRGVANQCAVRMSIALGRSGFGLEGFTPRDRVHSGNGACVTDGMSHVLAALELARYLRRALGEPFTIRPQPAGRGCAHAFTQIRGQTGIVYFNNCFTREGSSVQTGDHIDLFDGQQYYNQIIHPRAGGDETTGGNLFGRADEVWFWQLT
jgi:hypothetical protein